jgi:uncharacterized protein (DUF1778 family)
MSRIVHDSGRIALRIKPEHKALLARAAALESLDLTGFVVRAAVRAAERAIERSERLELSARDGARVRELLENPPPPPEKLRRAAQALPQP